MEKKVKVPPPGAPSFGRSVNRTSSNCSSSGGRHGGNSSSPWSQYIERRSKEVVVKIETGSFHVPLNILESRAFLAPRCANSQGEELLIVTSARTLAWPL
eukprot:scaffold98044_cov72-Phaeocystis_antarctica.AAC.7